MQLQLMHIDKKKQINDIHLSVVFMKFYVKHYMDCICMSMCICMYFDMIQASNGPITRYQMILRTMVVNGPSFPNGTSNESNRLIASVTFSDFNNFDHIWINLRQMS